MLGLLFFLLAFGGLFGYHFYAFLSVPPQTPGQPKAILIEPGQSFEAVAAMNAIFLWPTGTP